MSMRGKTIAVLGGDRRMAEAVSCFRQAGAYVKVAGLPLGEQLMGLQRCGSATEVLEGADLALLPVQGVTEEGKVFTQPGVSDLSIDLMSLCRMKAGGTLFTGIANQFLHSICQMANVSLVEYREADEFAIWNSIPSAEGAIQMAMETSPFTIFGSRSLVLGFGRTGRALALLLRGLFSQVAVAVRDELDFARVWASGHSYIEWSQLSGALAETDLIFNTVPAPVLTREVLAKAPSHAVVIDIASAPGGTDFEAARELGIVARLAPSLPGIVAPVTAGKIIAEMVLRYLNQRGEAS